MYHDAYQTTPCRDYVVDKIVAAIKRQRITNLEDFKLLNTPVKNEPISGLFAITPRCQEIPAFAHPIVIEEDDQRRIFVDMRNFTRLSREGDVVVSSKLDYDLHLLRGWLQSVWLKYSPMELLGLGRYPITIYSRWITEAITRRLALPPEVQMRVSVIVAYFYICMFYEEQSAEALDEKDRLKIGQLVASTTNVNATEVFNIIDTLDILGSVHGLCMTLQAHGGSMRLNDMNPALLYGILSGSWFGQNHRELVAVAVEHPVTWMAIVAKAYGERGYHNTVIGKLAKATDKGDIGKTYLFNILNLPTS